MGRQLVPTPFIEQLIENAIDEDTAEKAALELAKLKDVQCHLVTHYKAVAMQTQASGAGLRSLLEVGQPSDDTPPHLLGCGAD